MRTVHELNEIELQELRDTYFYQLLDTDPDVLDDIDTPSELPMDAVIEHYDGTYFVEEDFICNL